MTVLPAVIQFEIDHLHLVNTLMSSLVSEQLETSAAIGLQQQFAVRQ